jgi:tRNA G18 (ribose-2'-O)-methylase SpoU
MNEKKYPAVSNPHDPRFITLRSLQTHQGRSRTELYIIEGIRHLARAVEHCAQIESVFLDPSVLSNSFGQKLARRLLQRGVPGIRLSRELYRDLTLATEPQLSFGTSKLVAERRIELLVSRLSIECFEPTKLLRTMEPKSGIEPLTSCVPGRRSST